MPNGSNIFENLEFPKNPSLIIIFVFALLALISDIILFFMNDYGKLVNKKGIVLMLPKTITFLPFIFLLPFFIISLHGATTEVDVLGQVSTIKPIKEIICILSGNALLIHLGIMVLLSDDCRAYNKGLRQKH